MSLNFCFYPSDLAGLKPEHINMKDGTMTYRRSKTGVMRVGVFWERTLKALRSYQLGFPICRLQSRNSTGFWPNLKTE